MQNPIIADFEKLRNELQALYLEKKAQGDFDANSATIRTIIEALINVIQLQIMQMQPKQKRKKKRGKTTKGRR